MERPSLAIVIPAFNEAKTIGAIVESLLIHGTVIVVDDGSDDDTATIAKHAGAFVVTPLQYWFRRRLEFWFRKSYYFGK